MIHNLNTSYKQTIELVTSIQSVSNSVVFLIWKHTPAPKVKGGPSHTEPDYTVTHHFITSIHTSITIYGRAEELIEKSSFESRAYHCIPCTRHCSRTWDFHFFLLLKYATKQSRG